MRYRYCVIRFVPDAVRGEFVNVGVIMGSDESSEWEVRTIENLRRARSLDDRGLLRLVWTSIDDLGRMIDRFTESVQSNLFEETGRLSEEWLTRLSVESRNVVQFSQPSLIVADNIAEAINTIFQQFIVEPVSRQFEFKKKNEALAAMRRAYKAAGLEKQHWQENANVMGRNHKERFDFVVGNGRALQLAQTWSFQIPNQFDLSEQIKAWAWTVKDVRDHGGHAETSERRIEVPPDVEIEVIYIPPKSGGPRETMNEALAAFAELKVSPVEAQNARHVALSAFRLVGMPAH